MKEETRQNQCPTGKRKYETTERTSPTDLRRSIFAWEKRKKGNPKTNIRRSFTDTHLERYNTWVKGTKPNNERKKNRGQDSHLSKRKGGKEEKDATIKSSYEQPSGGSPERKKGSKGVFAATWGEGKSEKYNCI